MKDGGGANTSSPITQAAQVLSSAPHAMNAQDYGRALFALQIALGKRFDVLTRQDLEDVASIAAVRYINAVREGRVDTAKDCAGYLLRIAEYAAIDLLRRRKPELLLATSDLVELAPSDDDVALQFDRSATAELVRAALAKSRAEGDVTAFRVGSYFLDYVYRTGQAPSSRRCGEELALSHTAVANALRRLRKSLPSN